MKLPSNTTEGTPAASGPPSPKTFWSTVLTLTPVVMTVLATILAGLSSSEMTQAQYHRALAAQNQSKAGDQWNFFQAKRIRQQNLQATIDLLQTMSDTGKVEAAALLAAAEQLPDQLRQAVRESDQLLAAVGSAKGELGSAGDRLRQAAARARQVAEARLKEAEAALPECRRQLGDGRLPTALNLANTLDLPRADVHPIDEPEIVQAMAAVTDRLSDTEAAPLIKSIDEGTLRRAIEKAEANIQALERAHKPVSEALTRADRLVQQQAQRVRDLHRAVRGVTAALAEVPAGTGKGLDEVHAAADRLARTGAAAKGSAEEVGNDLKAARYGYTYRRYDEEARHNQVAATVYEIQVRKSSVSSESHRDKSRNFFFGMLAAQAAVMIATFSLAVKYRSLLWTLATAAGVGALAFGAWVYLR